MVRKGDGVPRAQPQPPRMQPPPCPTCASADVIPILWGEPSPEAEEDAKAGRIILAGCVVCDDDPEWHCKRCGKDFGRMATQLGV